MYKYNNINYKLKPIKKKGFLKRENGLKFSNKIASIKCKEIWTASYFPFILPCEDSTEDLPRPYFNTHLSITLAIIIIFKKKR